MLATPSPLINETTGFMVTCTVSGGSPPSGVQAFGTVSFLATGHATLTPAGLDAILSQYAAYLNGVSEPLPKHVVATCGLTSGSYSVQNTDLGAQQALIYGLLEVAANSTGVAS